MKQRRLKLSKATVGKPGGSIHMFGHRSHVSGKRVHKFAAQLKDGLVAQAKALEDELVRGIK